MLNLFKKKEKFRYLYIIMEESNFVFVTQMLNDVKFQSKEIIDSSKGTIVNLKFKNDEYKDFIKYCAKKRINLKELSPSGLICKIQ